MDDDNALRERLLAEAARVRKVRERVRSERNVSLAALLLGTTGLVLGCAQLRAAIECWTHPESVAFPISGRFFASTWDALHGRLSPDTALTFGLAAVGVCATINVALFVEALVASRRSQVELSEGRRMLEFAAAFLAVGAAVTGIVVWANLDSPHAAASAVGTSLCAVVAMLLAASARRQVQRAERALGYAIAEENLAKLDAWELELSVRGIPQPLGELPRDSNRKKLWARYWRAAATRLAVLALFMMLLVTVLVLTVWAVQLVRHHPVNLPFVVILAGLGAAAYIGAMAGTAIGWFTVRRYTDPYASKHLRFHLNVRPKLTRLGYCLVVGVILSVALIYDSTGAAIYIAVWLLPAQVLCWLALRFSRTRPEIRWSRWMTEPLWGMVALMLQNRRINQESNRDRYLQDEKDAAI